MHTALNNRAHAAWRVAPLPHATRVGHAKSAQRVRTWWRWELPPLSRTCSCKQAAARRGGAAERSTRCEGSTLLAHRPPASNQSCCFQVDCCASSRCCPAPAFWPPSPTGRLQQPPCPWLVAPPCKVNWLHWQFELHCGSRGQLFCHFTYNGRCLEVLKVQPAR